MKFLNWYVSKICEDNSVIISISFTTGRGQYQLVDFKLNNIPNSTAKYHYRDYKHQIDCVIYIDLKEHAITPMTKTLEISAECNDDPFIFSYRRYMYNVARSVNEDVMLRGKSIKEETKVPDESNVNNKPTEKYPIIKFAKLYPDVKIPSKRREDAGYDVYPHFKEKAIAIPPHHTEIINTGLVSSFSPDYYVKLQERGSTGTKGIAQRSGIIDSGYRGEWMIPITNTSEKWLVIKRSDADLTHADYYNMIQQGGYIPSNKLINGVPDNIIIYPYEKAICQFTIERNYYSEIQEVSIDDIRADKSERGFGRIGSSGK